MPADCSSVILRLKAEEAGGKGVVEFDDVRIVETTIPVEAAGHAFFEDFEHVDEGWGPFVYACNGQTQTHLSELHEGVTRDTINGRYSLKTINEPAGIVIRTTPAMLRLKPAMRYKVTCNYIADNDFYRLVVQGNIRSSKSVRLDKRIAKGTGTITETFATGSGTDSFLAIFKNKAGGGMLVIDDIVIDELGPAPAFVDDAISHQ